MGIIEQQPIDYNIHPRVNSSDPVPLDRGRRRPPMSSKVTLRPSRLLGDWPTSLPPAQRCATVRDCFPSPGSTPIPRADYGASTCQRPMAGPAYPTAPSPA